MAAVFVVSFCLLYCSVAQATVSYSVAVAPPSNLHAISAHPDKAAISVAQSGDNYAFTVVNSGPGSKVVQQQTVSGRRGAAGAPAVVQSTRHVVSHSPAKPFVGAYGAPVVHQPLVAASHQPVTVLHQSPTIVHQVVDGGSHVFRAVPIAHPVVVQPVVQHAVPIPYAAAAHHSHLLPTGHVVPTAGHVVHPGHVGAPHHAPTLLLAHGKK